MRTWVVPCGFNEPIRITSRPVPEIRGRTRFHFPVARARRSRPRMKKPGGNLSLTITPRAVAGPSLRTLTTNRARPPATSRAGPFFLTSSRPRAGGLAGGIGGEGGTTCGGVGGGAGGAGGGAGGAGGGFSSFLGAFGAGHVLDA